MKKRKVAATAIPLLLTGGLLVGIASGGPALGSTEPEVIRLISADDAVIRSYPLRGSDGSRGSIVAVKEALLDGSGEEVGRDRSSCVLANGVGWLCTATITLRAGQDTAAGTVVITGVFRGFNGESYAVTGGTGAYRDVGGHATLTVEDDHFVRTLYLLR